MGVNRGLSFDGINYLSTLVDNPTAKPDWMKFGTVLGQITGNYQIINFITGFKGLQPFMFKGKNWTIGGMAFDGILRTDHTSHVRTTQFPVQTGVTMTDHAIVEPAELTIDIMMTDAADVNIFGQYAQSRSMLESFVVAGATNILGDTAGKVAKIAVTADKLLSSGILGEETKKNYKGLFDWLKDEVLGGSEIAVTGEGRSVNAWKALKKMQLERQPLTVETRLQTYENMIIEELSAPDDYMTLNALKCTVHLKQILFANVAEMQVSARAAATKQASQGGTTPVQVQEPKKTFAKAAEDAAQGFFG